MTWAAAVCQLDDMLQPAKLLTVSKVLKASLLSDNEQRASAGIRQHGQRCKPPDERVANQVYLAVVFDPAGCDERNQCQETDDDMELHTS